MQNWSPEPFTTVKEVEPADSESAWLGEQAVSVSPSERLFRKDHWGQDKESLQELLTGEERQQLHRQIEEEVAAAYDQKLREIQIEQRQENEAWLARVAVEMRAATDQKLQDMARNTGSMAVALAERILRRAVEVDREVLYRAIEVLLMKVDADHGLELRVNPADQEFLGDDENLKQKLNITKIIPDRRVERGGCLARSGNQMWDATLQGQLEALAEVVNEIMAIEKNSGERPVDPTDPTLA